MVVGMLFGFRHARLPGQGPSARWSGRAILVGLLVLVGPMGPLPLGLSPARAQLSPNCLRNGKPLACAITPAPETEPRPVPNPANPTKTPAGAGTMATSLTVMFADHLAYRLIKEEGACHHRGRVSECPATIIPRNGFGTPIRGRYIGTAFEGGYRHEYRSTEVSITYFFVD